MRIVKRKHISFFVIVMVIFLGGWDIAHAQDTLTSVDDPLNGQYEMYTVDDLVIQKASSGSMQSTIENFILTTENNSIATQTKSVALTIDCTIADGPTLHTRAGRFFTLDRLAPGSDQRLLDYEPLPYIPADGSDTVSIPLRPNTAGEHRFVVVATRPGAVEGVGAIKLLVTDPAAQYSVHLPIVSTE